MHVKARILELTIITPVLIQATSPCQLTQRKQIGSPTLKEVKAHIHTIAKEVTLQTGRQSACGLPLQFRITDITDHLTRGTLLTQHTL